MDIPALVESTLGEDSVVSRVPLGGDDVLFVTPSRTLIYRAEGLLSDESVEEYPHDAERIEVSEGRRKAKLTLDYGLDGEETLALPAKRLDDALKPVLAGVLETAGIVDEDERVTDVFRFSELTLAITTKRVVKHIGAPVWDEDYEEYHYDDVTDLDFEPGSVATSIVLTLGDRQERFKAPNEKARAVREGLESALLDYYDVGSLEELRIAKEAEAEAAEAEAATAGSGDVGFGDGPDPLEANPGELPDDVENAPQADATAQQAGTQSVESPGASQSSAEQTQERDTEDAGFEGSGFEAAGPVDNQDISDELVALRETIEEQNRKLEQQHETLQQLIQELRRGR